MRQNIFKYSILFLVSLIFGFSVLFFRVQYEKSTGKSKSQWNVETIKEGDAKNFYDRGLALLQGQHYFAGCESAPIVAFYRPPGYSVFLALTFLIFGVSIKAVIVLQIILTTFIVVLISMITEMVFNKTIGRISGILAILYYPMWNDSVMINSELLSMFLGLLILFMILKYFYSEDNQLRYIILAGFLAGITALTRGQFFFYSLLLLIFIFNKKNIKPFRVSVYFLISALFPIILWSMYAYISSGIVMFISSQGPFSIWWGWSPLVIIEEKYPILNPSWDLSFINEDMIGTYLPAKSSLWFMSEALRFILNNPIVALKLIYFKLLDSWGFMEIYMNSGIFEKILKVFKFNWDFFIAIPGWIYLWKYEKSNKVFYLYILSACIIYSLICIMTAGLIRYRIPYLDPLFIILASYTIYKLYSNYFPKKSN